MAPTQHQRAAPGSGPAAPPAQRHVPRGPGPAQEEGDLQLLLHRLHHRQSLFTWDTTALPLPVQMTQRNSLPAHGT